jgi:VCBS repeat-containing protein
MSLIRNSALILAVFASTAAFAATKTYQVTGPVLEVTDTTFTVEKGKEKWTLTRDASTKTTGDLKVGEKVTVTYTMTATDVEVKADKKKK